MNSISGEEFTKQINMSYKAIIKWRPNMMKLPTGKGAKEFINKELAKWVEQRYRVPLNCP
jgi:hypothetical protein